MEMFAELRNTGTELFGAVGAWVFDEWKALNKTFFSGKNKSGPIIWGTSLQDESLGYYSVSENLIYLHKNLMQDSHNNHRFVQEVNRIAELLGLDVKARVIKQKKGREKVTRLSQQRYLTLKELYHFPYSSRPGAYYYRQL
jgi:hypothetical protein